MPYSAGSRRFKSHPGQPVHSCGHCVALAAFAPSFSGLLRESFKWAKKDEDVLLSTIHLVPVHFSTPSSINLTLKRAKPLYRKSLNLRDTHSMILSLGLKRLSELRPILLIALKRSCETNNIIHKEAHRISAK